MNEHLFDYLRDFLKNTYSLGFVDLLRVEGTASETAITAIGADRCVVIQAKTKTPVPEFVGVFGMPSLSNLNTILGISEYKEKAKISVTAKDDGSLSGIHFENSTGDFKNEYRFMSQAIANDKLKQVTFKGANWLLEFEPSAIAIQKFGFQAQANSEETMFTFGIEKNDLHFYFGDHSSQSGDYVFAANVKAAFKHKWAWPIGIFKGIMALPGDKVLKLSDEGVIMITVDSGLVDYQYLIPAMIK